MANSCNPHEDDELRGWLRWQSVHGNSFLRALSEAVSMADWKAYEIMRPALLALKKLNE